MNTKVLIIIGFSYLYGFFEYWMNVKQRRNAIVTHSGDKGSLWLLYFVITIGYVLSFSIGSTKIGRLYAWDTFFALGASCVVLGLTIRIQSILTLKKSFTYSVAMVVDQELIESGLYKYIRHPGYLGQIIIFFGISVSLSNWISIIFMMIPITIGYSYRIKVEERFMIEHFGGKYSEYQKRTNKLIPMVY